MNSFLDSLPPCISKTRQNLLDLVRTDNEHRNFKPKAQKQPATVPIRSQIVLLQKRSSLKSVSCFSKKNSFADPHTNLAELAETLKGSPLKSRFDKKCLTSSTEKTKLNGSFASVEDFSIESSDSSNMSLIEDEEVLAKMAEQVEFILNGSLI